MEKFVAFLRGINVGGHHKVPMAELRSEFEKMNFKNIATILNSGNVLYEADQHISDNKISERLEEVFGFPVPIVSVKFEMIVRILKDNPFKNIESTKDTRLYVSFLKNDVNAGLSLPWKSEDGSFKIIEKREKMIFSVLDLSISKTVKAMEILEKYYGKEITTRNWNTIERIQKKAAAQQWL